MDSNTLEESKQQTGNWRAHRGSNVVKLLRAANVKRYHTISILGEQNVGHHSHRVCLVLRYLLGGEVPSKLYEAALFHDLAECATGDIPAHIRWSSEKLANTLDEHETLWLIENNAYVTLCDEEQELLNIADKLELVWFCTEQMLMGNQTIRGVRERGIDYCLHLGSYEPSINKRIDEFVKECYNECQ